MSSWKYFAHFFGSYYTFFISITVNMTWFVAGITISWTSPVLIKLSCNDENPLGKPLTSQQVGLMGTLLFLAAACGPLVFMRIPDVLGRKRALVLSLLPCLIGYVILTFARRVESYYAARILNGLTLGATGGLSASYLSEIIYSAKKRGKYLSLTTPAIQLGALFCYIIGPYLSLTMFNALIGFVVILNIILLEYGCPESPYFILEIKGKNASFNILKELQVEDVEKELLQIEEDISKTTQTSIFSLFKSMQNFKLLVMATSLLLLQIFSGMVVILAYSQEIFEMKNGILSSEKCSIVVGLIQCISATATVFTVRKFNRKSLLIVSLLGSGVFDLILGLYFLYSDALSAFNWIPLVAIVSFYILYNSGLDPMPWVYLGEIFPAHLKSAGTAISPMIYWVVSSAISFAYTEISFSCLFLVFSASCFVGAFCVKLWLTETKDKTLREIQEELEK